MPFKLACTYNFALFFFFLLAFLDVQYLAVFQSRIRPVQSVDSLAFVQAGNQAFLIRPLSFRKSVFVSEFHFDHGYSPLYIYYTIIKKDRKRFFAIFSFFLRLTIFIDRHCLKSGRTIPSAKSSEVPRNPESRFSSASPVSIRPCRIRDF